MHGTVVKLFLCLDVTKTILRVGIVVEVTQLFVKLICLSGGSLWL